MYIGVVVLVRINDGLPDDLLFVDFWLVYR